MRYQAKEVSQLLANCAEDVARELCSTGKRITNEWCVGDVTNNPGKSLHICLSGPRVGRWTDFATGEGGDLLDLWVKRHKITLPEAIKEATRYLCLPQEEIVSPTPSKEVLGVKTKVVSTKVNSVVMNYLCKERKLMQSVLEDFSIGEKDRQIIFPYMVQQHKEKPNFTLCFIKYLNVERQNGKKQIFVEKNAQPCLFGWQAIPSHARTITICEGEIDAMTLYQYGINALSVPFGGGKGEKHKWLEYEYERLAIYDEIFLCFDNDEEGSIATAFLMERLGQHRCRIVKLPYKDANECLLQNVSEETMKECFVAAKSLDPKELKLANNFLDKVIDIFYPDPHAFLGYEMPWEKAKGKILLRHNELSVWTGINGHGKSQLLGHIILQSIKQGAKVCIASLELSPERLLLRLARQASAVLLPTKKHLTKINEWYGNNLYIFDLVGSAKSERLLKVFTYAKQRYGVDFFVIDSFLKLDIADEDYREQKSFMEKLCDFKNQYKCHINIVVHPRKSADELAIPGKLDTKGTGSITDLADNCFAVWRNKAKENAKYELSEGREITKDQYKKFKEPDCLLGCDKQRNGEWESKLWLWFDKESLQYIDYDGKTPYPFVLEEK